MILIADGGSTKCDWVALDETGEIAFRTRTPGLNPSVLSTQKLHLHLTESEEITYAKSHIKQLYFYGAGCGTDKNQSRLEEFFKKFFKPDHCEVRGDLHAACYSVTLEPGLVCILGTGSNSCYFDGVEVYTRMPALGYMLMDEASGNYFGKQLIRDYFYKRMPGDLAKKFSIDFDLRPHNIQMNLYKKSGANAYLAEFSRFIFENDPSCAYFENLVASGIRKFIENRVLTYKESANVPVHFVGSIAYFSRDIITRVLPEYGLIQGNIIRHPIDGLIRSFQKRIKNNMI